MSSSTPCFVRFGSLVYQRDWSWRLFENATRLFSCDQMVPTDTVCSGIRMYGGIYLYPCSELFVGPAEIKMLP